jgi:hypothetical protein
MVHFHHDGWARKLKAYLDAVVDPTVCWHRPYVPLAVNTCVKVYVGVMTAAAAAAHVASDVAP